jgi:DNA-binding transcriptional LysR family regulator
MVIDLRLIQHALTLARHRNYARAAEALHLSQPALSRSISGLEAALGVRLFDRTRQGVAPTAFGERLLARGLELLTDAAELERELKLMQGLKAGVLRIGAGPYPAELSVGTAVGRLAGRYPQVRIEVHTADWRVVRERVLGAELDLGVIELSTSDQDPRLVIEPLPQHPGALFCRAGHPLLKEKSLTLEDLLKFPFVAGGIPPRAAETFNRLAKAGVIDPDTGDYLPAVRVDTMGLTKSVVLLSDAVGIGPRKLLENELQARQLAVLPLHPPWLHTNYGFVHLRERAPAPAVQALMSEIRAIEAQIVKSESRVTDLRPRRLRSGALSAPPARG